MTIDNKFYSITQTNANLNSQNSLLSQEFSQILTQTIQNKETQSQAKFTGNIYEDGQNGLLSDEEKRVLPVIIGAAQVVVGNDLAWKMGKNPFEMDYDFVTDKHSGLTKQRETLTNGDKAEREQLLRAYKQALESNRVIHRNGRQRLNVAIEYINKALGDL